MFPFRGVYFGMFDTLNMIKPDTREYGILADAFATYCIAQATAITAGYASYPFDTVRRHLMMEAKMAAEAVRVREAEWAVTQRELAAGQHLESGKMMDSAEFIH